MWLQTWLQTWLSARVKLWRSSSARGVLCSGKGEWAAMDGCGGLRCRLARVRTSCLNGGVSLITPKVADTRAHYYCRCDLSPCTRWAYSLKRTTLYTSCCCSFYRVQLRLPDKKSLWAGCLTPGFVFSHVNYMLQLCTRALQDITSYCFSLRRLRHHKCVENRAFHRICLLNRRQCAMDN